MTSPRQLTALDTQFLAGEDGAAHGHFACVAMLDGSALPEQRLTIERLRATIADRVPATEALGLRLAKVPWSLDLPYWVPADEIDIGFTSAKRFCPRTPIITLWPRRPPS